MIFSQRVSLGGAGIELYRFLGISILPWLELLLERERPVYYANREELLALETMGTFVGVNISFGFLKPDLLV